MASFKTRDKPLRRAKQRVSTVVVVLLCILSLGVVSSLTVFNSSGGSSGGGGTSSSRPTVDSGNSNTGDNSGNGSTGDSSGDNESETPSGSTGDNTGGDNSGDNTGGNTGDDSGGDTTVDPPKMLNEQFFSESLSYSAGDEALYFKGGALLNDRITYGTVDTSEGYLRYRPKAEEVGTEVSKSILSLYLNKESSILSELPIHLDEAACITIDFDIWSDTGVFPDCGFTLQSSNEEIISLYYTQGVVSQNEQYYVCHNSSSGLLLVEQFMDPVDVNEPIHFTIVLRFDFNDNKMFLSEHVNGNRRRIHYESDVFLVLRLLELNFEFSNHTVFENESICIDNLQVYSYGDSLGNYKGDLGNDQLNMNISDYTDWILYDKYKTEEGEE